jgi:hypothetical protein
MPHYSRVIVIEGFPFQNRGAGKSGPANKPKPGGGDSKASAKPGGSKPPFGGGPAVATGEDPEVAMAKFDAEQEAAAMAAAEEQAKIAAEKKEQEQSKKLRAKADEEVLDDLRDDLNDSPDEVEFYPSMDTFGQFTGKDAAKQGDDRGPESEKDQQKKLKGKGVDEDAPDEDAEETDDADETGEDEKKPVKDAPDKKGKKSKIKIAIKEKK